MMIRWFAAIASLMLLFSLGCSDDKVSSSEEKKMKDALAGKNVGPMPEETRKKMEAAMRNGMPQGQPVPSPGAAVGSAPDSTK